MPFKINKPKVTVPKVRLPSPPPIVRTIEHAVDHTVTAAVNTATDAAGTATKAVVKPVLNVALYPVNAAAEVIDAKTGSHLAPQIAKAKTDIANVAAIVNRATVSFVGDFAAISVNTVTAAALGDIKETAKQLEKLLTGTATVAITGGGIEVARLHREYLRNQAQGKWQTLPKELVDILSKYYQIDFAKIRFATCITINPYAREFPAITMDYDIFFVNGIDLHNPDDLHLMLHELEHVRQYEVAGGFEQFMLKYCAQGISVGLVHDNIELEKQAEDKANTIIAEVFAAYAASTNATLATAAASTNNAASNPSPTTPLTTMNHRASTALSGCRPVDSKCTARLFAAGSPHCFWVDGTSLRYGVVDAKGTLSSKGVLSCTFSDIQIAVIGNSLFWQEPSPSTKLMRATVVDGKLSGIAVVDANSKIRLMTTDANYLYWQDHDSSIIHRRKVEGSKMCAVEIIDKTADKNLVCMAAQDGYFYWRDSNTTVLRRGMPDAKSESIQHVAQIDNHCNAVIMSADSGAIYWRDSDSNVLYRAHTQNTNTLKTPIKTSAIGASTSTQPSAYMNMSAADAAATAAANGSPLQGAKATAKPQAPVQPQVAAAPMPTYTK